jgi:hypothetical protein
MFGALLGTLQKFRQEETRMRDKAWCYSIIGCFPYFMNDCSVWYYNFLVCLMISESVIDFHETRLECLETLFHHHDCLFFATDE